MFYGVSKGIPSRRPSCSEAASSAPAIAHNLQPLPGGSVATLPNTRSLHAWASQEMMVLSFGQRQQQQQQWLRSRAMAATVLLLLVFATTPVSGQTQRLCEGELGQANWACDAVSPIPPDSFEEFFPLPGSPDPANPTKYKQIAGEPAFDEDTGMTRGDASAVYVLTEGTYFCMLAESNGEAVLFDAPEGSNPPDWPRVDVIILVSYNNMPVIMSSLQNARAHENV